MRFEKYHNARLALFSNRWMINLEDETPKIFYNKRYVGELEYHMENDLERIIKAGQWYRINCLSGSYKVINNDDDIKEKTSS